MDSTSGRRGQQRYLTSGVIAVFLLSLLLAGVRVSLPEPPNPIREGRFVPATDETAPDVNRFYDRPADEADYFAPVIRQMAQRWPQIDWQRDTRVEKPPGYPLLMATVAQVTGPDFRWLRAFQMLLSACIPAILYRWLRGRLSPAEAAVTVAPLVCSSFFIKSSSYLTTDNPTLLCTTLVLMVLLAERLSTAWMVVVVGCATLAASFRQDALWLAAPLAMRRAIGSGWWSDGKDKVETMPWSQRLLLLAAILLPGALVLRVVVEWGGLVPRSHVRGINDPGFSVMPIVYLLAVVALLWGPWLWARFGARELWCRVRERAALGAAAAGLALVVLTHSAYDRALGHWGGYLWSVAAHLPEIAGRSPVFLVLAPLGALALGVTARELWRENARAAVLLGAAMGTWALACCFNPLVFHRYYEPPALVFLLLAAGMLSPAQPRGGGWRDRWPLLALGAVQLLITVATLYLSLFATLRR